MLASVSQPTVPLRPLLRAGILLGIVAFAATAQAQFLYTVTDLGIASPASDAYDINDRGQVVGDYYINGAFHAFVHDGVTLTDLGGFGGNASYATSINSNGHIVGYSYTADGKYRAFLYNGSSMLDLGAFGNGYSQAYAINDSDSVVGESSDSGYTYTHPFLYESSSLSDLTDTAGVETARARARSINNLGQIVGEIDDSIPVLWTGSGVVSLASRGAATDINNLGQIVGYSDDGAFLYDENVMINLGIPTGFDTSYANAINDLGQIVGYCYRPGSPHAFLSDGSVMTDLNTVTDFSGTNFVTLENARSINNLGQIVGTGFTSSGTIGAFLLTPISLSAVPEPSTYAALCTVGLAALAGHRLHRRRRVAKAGQGVSGK